MNNRIYNILKLSIKFENIISFGQFSTHQNDIGNAESIALQKTGVWSLIKRILVSQIPKNSQVDIKFQLTIGTDSNKNAIKVDYNSTEIYYVGCDLGVMNKLGQSITAQFGQSIAQSMLSIYKKDAGCKKILQSEAQPNASYAVVIKIPFTI